MNVVSWPYLKPYCFEKTTLTGPSNKIRDLLSILMILLMIFSSLPQLTGFLSHHLFQLTSLKFLHFPLLLR